MKDIKLKDKIAQGINDLFYIWKREFQTTFRDQGVLIFFILVPLGYPLLYSFIYDNEVVREVPAVVVDDSHSSLSREYLRKVDATPDIQIVSYCADMEEAKQMLKNRRAYGIIYIPSDFSDNIAKGKQTQVSIYCDMSGLLYYKSMLIANTAVSLDMNKDIKPYTLSILVQDIPGVLSQVARLFARKGYNIESLAVGTTDDPTVSRITIEVMADAAMIEQIMNQLRKQFSVYSVQELLPERSIRRELVMFKVRAETPDIRNEIIQIANIFRASIIDVSLKSLTLALIGDETKADAMQKLLEAFGILELVRTGMVALERGAYTIGDETKEQTEFNLGKNFL